MKKKRIFLIISYVLFLVFPVIIYLSGSNSTNVLYIISGILGISSYVLFSMQFLLVSRIKFIENSLGLDHLYRYHMYLSIPALLFGFLHKLIRETFFSESLQTQLGDAAIIIFITVMIFSILFMIKKLFIKTKLGDQIRIFLSSHINLKHQYKVLLHNVTLCATILILVHVLMAYSTKSNLLLKLTLIFYFAIPVSLYLYRKIISNYILKSKQYKIIELKKENNSIMTIKFMPVHGTIFSYLPGQFLYLTCRQTGLSKDEHPFTISSSPTNKEYLSVTVKQLGDFTKNLDKLSVDDIVHIDGPFGTFSHLEHHNNKICFLAGGIGITPFLSMLRYLADENSEHNISLFWGVRDQSELICCEELEQIVKKLTHFRYIPVCSNEPDFSGQTGFITKDFIFKHLPDYINYDFYLCGPPVMMDAQLNNLKALGIQKKHIHYETFSM